MGDTNAKRGRLTEASARKAVERFSERMDPHAQRLGRRLKRATLPLIAVAKKVRGMGCSYEADGEPKCTPPSARAVPAVRGEGRAPCVAGGGPMKPTTNTARVPDATAVYVAEQLMAAESEIDNARALPNLPVDRLACVARAFHHLAEASRVLAPWEVSRG